MDGVVEHKLGYEKVALDPLTGLTPESVFINLAIDANNGQLDSEYRNWARLHADFGLTTAAILAENGGKPIKPEQLKEFLAKPGVVAKKQQLIEKYRTPDPRFKDQFYTNAASAMNELYPVAPVSSHA